MLRKMKTFEIYNRIYNHSITPVFSLSNQFGNRWFIYDQCMLHFYPINEANRGASLILVLERCTEKLLS